PNGDALRKCILEGPYQPTTVTIPAVPATTDSPTVPERTTVETIFTMSPENKAHYESEREAIHLLLTRIGDEIYSTVDAYKTTHEMWIAIERLQQGESLNIQDVKTNLFWVFRKFTSHDGESMESYYSRFYKMMNEMIRNNLTVATMQVNVQFLQQLQLEWSRFVTIVKQQHDLDTISYHKLFDVLKQYQKEVNEICTERIAKNVNPLALVATASPYPGPYYQAPTSHKPYTPTSKQSSSTRSNSSTKFKGKEIAKPITPLSESASEEDNTTPRYKNDNQTGQFGNQRTITVVGARETVGSQVVQHTGIQYFNCKEFGHFAKECRKPKRVKDSTYHKEKMLLCKQAEKGVPLQTEQSDWLADTDEEIDDQELEAHTAIWQRSRRFLLQTQELILSPLEQFSGKDGYKFKLDVDENKKIQKQLKKANASLAHELKECKSTLAKTSRTMGESNSILDSCLIALQNKQTEFERYKTLNDRTIDYDKLEHKLNETLGLLAQQEIVIKECLKLKAYEISVVKEKHDELVKQSLLTKSLTKVLSIEN
ncbi:retrovirus-related pol polyprotein from transposon TNT 1-94, partial [Tanacetum coccineum]